MMNIKAACKPNYRELGDQILALLNDDRTEDILLNPDGWLWAKRMGDCFASVGPVK